MPDAFLEDLTVTYAKRTGALTAFATIAAIELDSMARNETRDAESLRDEMRRVAANLRRLVKEIEAGNDPEWSK